MAVRAALTALLLLAPGVPALAGEAEPLRHAEGSLFQMNGLEEVTNTRIGAFRLDSAGSGDLRETPGMAELSLFSGGTLRTSDGVASEARAVDVRTGRPVVSPGTVCDPNGLFGPPDTSGCLALGSSGPQNRQLFDDLCRATVGVASAVAEELADRCLLDILNENSISILSVATGILIPITDPRTQPTFSGFFSNLFVGNLPAASFAGLLAPGASYISLNQDPGDLMPSNCDDALVNCFYASGSPANDGTDPIRFPTLNMLLTPQQQALLGCGPFYATNCEVDGIALFDTEAGVGVQSFPQIEPHPPVARRVDPATGGLVILPGARGPTDPDYDPLVDGCIAPSGTFPGDDSCAPDAPMLLNPLTGELFPNELAVVSYNFMILLASLSLPDPDCDPDPTSPNCDPDLGDPDCELTTAEGLIACGSLRSAVALLAHELEDDPSGPPQRRWLWESGAEFLRTHEASGDFSEFATWTFHAVGPEVSRRDKDDEAGVLLLLFPPDEVVAASDSPLVAGDPGPGFVGFYGVVPEPSQGLLQLAALLAAAGFARRRRRA